MPFASRSSCRPRATSSWSRSRPETIAARRRALAGEFAALVTVEQIDQAVMDNAIKKMNMPVLIPKATGKTQKIAGYNCELYTIQLDSTQEMDIWLTKEFPKDLLVAIRNCTEAGMKNTGVKSDALMALFQNGYAQVKMEMKYNGITQLTNEFAKAEPQKLDDSMFTVPTNIKVEKFDPTHMNPGSQGK